MCVSTSPSISRRCEDSCRVDTTAGWVSDLSQTIDVCLPITHTNLDSPPLAMCVCVCRGVIQKFWTLFTHIVYWSLGISMAFHRSIRLGPAQLCAQQCRVLFTSEPIPIMKFGELRSETPSYIQVSWESFQ